MIANRYYLPYSYYSLIMTEKKEGKYDIMTIDPKNLFCHKGETIFHKLSRDFKNFKLFINYYEKNLPEFLNLILLSDTKGNNVLDSLLEDNDSRGVNLVLETIVKNNMSNTIHLLKKSYPALLSYSSFQ